MKSLKDQIIAWNIEFPFDRIWRKRYEILFGSKQHLESNFIDMCFQLREELMYARMEKLKNKIVDDETVDNSNFMTDEEIDNEFENLNLEDYV